MYLVLIGIFFILFGCIFWYKNEMNTISNPYVFISIIFILFGSSLFFSNIDKLITDLNFKPYKFYKNNKKNEELWNWIFVLGLIYIGTICYTIASYYHLKFEKWSFIQALIIAIPFVLIEYQFSIRGNYYAKKQLTMNAIQITLITMIFYFINSWLLNYFVLKSDIVWWRELLAFLLVFIAFIITTNRPNHTNKIILT